MSFDQKKLFDKILAGRRIGGAQNHYAQLYLGEVGYNDVEYSYPDHQFVEPSPFIKAFKYKNQKESRIYMRLSGAEKCDFIDIEIQNAGDIFKPVALSH